MVATALSPAEIVRQEMAKTYRVSFFRPGATEAAKVQEFTGLAFSTICVKMDEWRQWVGGTATVETVEAEQAEDTEGNASPKAPSDGIVDYRGRRHLVSFSVEYHNFFDGWGELRAECVCGWWDTHRYERKGQAYAQWKLMFRATDHVPVKVGQERAA